MGLRGLDVRKDGFGGREMGLWVLRERGREILGWGAAMDDGEKKNLRKIEF